MTESNVTKEHEGKHGVLTLGAARNPVTVKDVRTWDFDALIDGADAMNTFFQSDGWQFTPDPDPLPTEPGWYVQTSVTRRSVATPVLYYLDVDSGWYQNLGRGTYSMTDRGMTGLHARDPLVRVSFGVAS